MTETTSSKTQIHSKVGGGAAAGALSLVFVWLLSSYGYVIPNEIQGSFTILFAFVGGYLASE